MAIKLHTCGVTFLHIDQHPCWKVQKTLDEAGIEYEQIKHPTYPRSRRKDVEKLSGQTMLPVIEFEDGHVLREETKDLVARIRAGKLEEAQAPATT
jgi:glutaredoxin